ncbi:MAG: hypothetical protein ACRDPR_13465, partial [Nocardioidaceae bacterium]
TLDSSTGTLEVHLDDDELTAREPAPAPVAVDGWAGTGRELFSSFRAAVSPADQGATVFAPAST